MDQESPQNQDISEHDYIAELVTSNNDVKFPPGFNALSTEDKQEWAKGQIEVLKPDKEVEEEKDGEEENEEEKNEVFGEVKEVPSDWGELNNLLSLLDIDLDFDEKELTGFQEKNLLEEKSAEIKETIESFPNRNLLKEKFASIKLRYPKYEEKSKIFIENNILYLDLSASKQEISDFLNSLVFEVKDKEEENVEQAPTSAPVPESVAEAEPTVAVPLTEKQRNETMKMYDEFVKNKNLEELLLRLHPEVESTLQKLKDPNLPVEEFWKTVQDFNDKYYDSDKAMGMYHEFRFFIPGRKVKIKYSDDGNISISAYLDQPTTPEPKNATEQVEIKEAIGKDGEVISKGDLVFWVSLSGETMTGQIIFFSKLDDGSIIAHIKSPGVTDILEKSANTLKSFATQPINPTETLVAPELAPTQAVVGWEEDLLPEWQKGEEWKKFEEMRDNMARYEVPRSQLGMSSIGLELKRSEYNSYKGAIAKKIGESFRKNAGENLTPEQEVELSQVIHDKINEELLDKEQNSYKKALQEHRTETFGDKAKEALKTALGAKAVQWYLRLPKTQRMALNFALGTSIGLAAGLGASVGAAGYVGFRAVRYGASFGGSTLGTAIGEKKKSWSLEDLDKKEKEETESMENSDKSWDEKSREFEEIKNRYEKERRNIKLKKAAVAVGFGAGSGILAGLSGHLTNVAEVVSTPKGGNIGGVKTGIAEHLENVKPKVSAEKLFENPENLKHIKVGGKVNSFWDTVKKGLDENERFKNFTEAQKQNAASFYANKGINNPGKYGLTPDSNFGVRVETGKEVDLSKLFANAEEMKKVLNGAAKKTLEEQKEILERSTKIAGWVKANPNGSLTEDKVSEILSSKPKTEISPESIMKNRIHEVLGDKPAPVEPPSPMPTHLEAQPEPPKAQFPSHFPDYRAGGGVVAAGMAPIIGTLDKKGQEQMHKEIRGEIDEAKSKLAKLEEKNEVKGVTNIRNPNLERSFASDSELTQEIDEAFKRGVDTIYGKSGFMGLGKTIGVNTKEWGEMARLPASKVVEYYTGDSTKSGLFPDPEDAKKLSESKNHNAFMRQTSDLINEANRLAIERGGVDVKFKPFDNGENMEQFIKRLAGYISKISSQNLIKAA